MGPNAQNETNSERNLAFLHKCDFTWLYAIFPWQLEAVLNSFTPFWFTNTTRLELINLYCTGKQQQSYDTKEQGVKSYVV